VGLATHLDSGVETGSRQENASNQEQRPVSIRSKRKRLWLSHPCHANFFCKTSREHARYDQDVPGLTAVKTQRPIASDEEHRVLKFRPRTQAQPPGRRPGPADHAPQDDIEHEANDLSRYERDRSEPDDFRHRMLANIAAFAFTVALTAIGIWLAMSIADMRKTQDCVLMGRRDCARISTPHF
jgi:hypothetical protein